MKKIILSMVLVIGLLVMGVSAHAAGYDNDRGRGHGYSGSHHQSANGHGNHHNRAYAGRTTVVQAPPVHRPAPPRGNVFHGWHLGFNNGWGGRQGHGPGNW